MTNIVGRGEARAPAPKDGVGMAPVLAQNVHRAERAGDFNEHVIAIANRATRPSSMTWGQIR